MNKIYKHYLIQIGFVYMWSIYIEGIEKGFITSLKKWKLLNKLSSCSVYWKIFDYL